MKTRAFLGLLVAVQTACVALGLGFQYVYVRASLDHALQIEAKGQLAEDARRIAVTLTTARIASIDELRPTAKDGAARIEASRVLESAVAKRNRALLVDADWQYVLNPAENDAADSADKVVWRRSRSMRPQSDDSFHGLIESPRGNHFAVAYPLASRDGYVLVETDLATLPISPAVIKSNLLAAAGISLPWMAGLMAVSLYMIVSHQQEGLLKQRSEPEMDAFKQTQALLRTQETVIFALAKLSDSRDPETGDHLERISFYSSTLAAALRQHPDFRDVVTPNLVRLIGLSSALHDIGKVGVEDAILKKPGSLTTAERSRMQQHTRVGEDCLKEIERRLGTSNFLQMAREIASAHHERWDGTGYPLGLAGEEIPVAARIVAIADVYDALSSKRVYKEALPHEKCVELIVQEAGQHFDPRLVKVFAEIEPSFRAISRQLASQKEAEATSSPAIEPQRSLSGGRSAARGERAKLTPVELPPAVESIDTAESEALVAGWHGRTHDF